MNNSTETNDDDDSSVGSLPPPPGCEDAVEATKLNRVEAPNVSVKRDEERENAVTAEGNSLQGEEKHGEDQFAADAAAGVVVVAAGAGADDDDKHNSDIKEPQSKGFLSPLMGSSIKDAPYEAIAPSPTANAHANITAGSPVGYGPILGNSPPYPYAGYAAPPAAQYPPYPSPHRHPHHHYPYRYPYPSSSTDPQSIVRKSVIRAVATGVFPATPASNPSVLAGLRNSTSAKKVSPKATPNSVLSSPPVSGSGSKAQRGLRHFSVMVCKHVEERGSTNYNEVADELVAQVVEERTLQGEGNKGKFDEKNIRRRVYDA
jgi:E2F/DP family winged-helix DNA-binding domain